MSVGQIFGSPPEPIFNLHGVCVQPDLLEDILYTLASKSEENTKSAIGQNYGQFCGGNCAKYIFLLCECFNQPPETRYLAVDIFDKFMSKHLCGLYKYISTSQKYVDRKKDWKELELKLGRLMCLRMLSAVQLASKLCSHSKILTLRKCQRFLTQVGHRYTTDSILLSELSILKTLDFKVPSASALTYIEAILEILGYNDNGTNVKVLHATCLDILDVTILQRQEVYSKLCALATNSMEASQEDLKQFATVEQDLMYLAVSVISAASYIIDREMLQRVVDHISKITRIPCEDILDFSNILIQECVLAAGIKSS